MMTRPLAICHYTRTFVLVSSLCTVLGHGLRAPYTLHFRNRFYDNSNSTTKITSRDLGELGKLRRLNEVMLAFDFESQRIKCNMDQQSTVYTGLALTRMKEEHPPVTYESENCILTFLNETSFDGVTLFNDTLLHFHRTDHEVLELDLDTLQDGGEECIARESEGRNLRSSPVAVLPDDKPGLWSDCYPGVSTGYKLLIGIAVGSSFQQTFAKSTTAQVQSMVSAVNFAFKNQLNIELTVDHLYLGPGPFNEDCATGIDLQFSAFIRWQKPSTQGLWHIIDDCLGLSGERCSGTAYRGAVCRSPKNIGITYCSGRGCSRGYKTLAHEIGHNFGAGHSFEEGVRRTGGIMDYGRGILDGIFQFNSKYRKDEICRYLRRVIPTCSAFHRQTKKTAYPTPFPMHRYPTQFPTKVSTIYPTMFPQHRPTSYPSRFPSRSRFP